MNADDLRAVAAEIREKANDAEREGYGSDHPGKPWCPDWTYMAVRHVNRNMDMECPEHQWDAASEDECNTWGRYAGYHVAAWHPAVALAVADWLNLVAHGLEYHEAHGAVIDLRHVARAEAFVKAWRGEQP